MLRLPTVINFPLMFWKNKRQGKDNDEESTNFLLPEETFVKHHGSICYYYPDDITPLEDDQKISMHYFLKHHEVRDELAAILRFAVPLIVTFLLGVGNRVVDVWFLGKVGSEGKALICMKLLCKHY